MLKILQQKGKNSTRKKRVLRKSHMLMTKTKLILEAFKMYKHMKPMRLKIYSQMMTLSILT